MAPSNIGYSLREAFSHFFRNWTTSFGAVITIFLSLFIIGLFIVGSALVTSAIGTIEDTVTINVFISDDATDDEVQAFQEKLESWQNVQSVNFKSKDDALEDWRNMSSSADSTIAALDGENPLPRSYEVVMEDSSQVEDMANRIKEDTDFQAMADNGDVDESVQYSQEMVGRLFQVTGYIRIACIVLVALLTFIAFIFINNTIRLSITARRREIAIMRLVGASNGFIRGPFVTEGVLQALLGALLSIANREKRFPMSILNSRTSGIMSIFWVPVCCAEILPASGLPSSERIVTSGCWPILPPSADWASVYRWTKDSPTTK